MKAEIVGFTEKILPEYKFVKEIDGPFIKEKINAEIKFVDDEYKTLLAKFAQGEDKEIGIISKACGEHVFSKDVYIKHNEGSPDLVQCEFEKTITFTNPLDCLIKKQINIFDYTAETINSIQGSVNRVTYANSKYLYIGDESQQYTLDQIISELGGIPDKTAFGYSIEYAEVSAIPEFEEVTDPGNTYNSYYRYIGHNCYMIINYIGTFSNIKYNGNWVEDQNSPGNYWLNPFLFPQYIWGQPYVDLYREQGEYGAETYYTRQTWEKGLYKLYKEVGISNAIVFNEILMDIFSCSGLALVSNFLGINPDSSQPNNIEYTYAAKYCQNIRILQSYDIIKATATQDSFDKSGIIKTKDLLEDLCFCFNLKVVPDTTNGIIRLEHISYFSRKGVDISDPAKFAYKFFKAKINEREVDGEEFSFAKSTPTDNYYSVTIDYENIDLYKTENIKKYKAKFIITDVFGTIDNEEFTKSDDYKKLFYLVATDSGALVEFNYPFSMREIVTNLYMSNRPNKTGLVNGVYTKFKSFSAGFSTKIEMQSSLIAWDTLQPYHTIKCQQGSFQISEIEIDETDLLTIKILK